MGILKRLRGHYSPEARTRRRAEGEIREHETHEREMARLNYDLARARRGAEKAERISEIRRLQKKADRLAPRQQGGIIGNLGKMGDFAQRGLKNLDAIYGNPFENQGRKSKKRREWWE